MKHGVRENMRRNENPQDNTIKGMMLGAIIGDAVGTPIDGMSKGHIQSIFKSIDGYIDPSPGLKGRMNRWKMPGLYSSLSQMMMILSFILSTQKSFKETNITDFIKAIPDISENEFGILRHPGILEKNFISRIIAGDEGSHDRIFSYPCARAALIISPAAYYTSRDNLVSRAISLSMMFNRDIDSIAGALMFTILLRDIITESRSFTSSSLIAHAIETASSLSKEIETNPDKIFEKGINPDSLLASMEKYAMLFSNLENIKSREAAEEKICSFLNSMIKSPVTRATVNHPLAIIPYSIYLTSSCIDSPLNTLFTAANEGGSSSILCSLAGTLNGAIFGAHWIPEELKDSLVNKKRIGALIEEISRQKVSDFIIQDFIDGEASLTKKEIQELNAKLKHTKPRKPNKKKKKFAKDKEKELSRHVVESWTKTDQAKWRKKLDKQEK